MNPASDGPDASASLSSTRTGGALTNPTAHALPPSAEASERLVALRSRFATKPAPELAGGTPDLAARASSRAVIGEGVVERFELAGERVQVALPQLAQRGVAHPATVELPASALGEVGIEDDTHLAVRFALLGAHGVPIETAEGLALYRGAIPGADVVHRAHAEGTEDFVVFEARPAREELAYRVDVSRVAGLRLVSNVVEFLDATGTPRLRIAPPYVVDAAGARSEAKLAIEGCAYDTDARAPWGRGVTSAGAERCVVRVAWAGVAYPAVVDPAWTTTGSMAVARSGHTASLLASGRVLVAGGVGSLGDVGSAELYDPSSSTFAMTGSMATARGYHAATNLSSGKILLAGGCSVGSAETYEPTSGTFAPAGSMGTDRRYHTASLLGSGQALVAGGSNTYGNLASAELYDPTSNTWSPAGSLLQARRYHAASLVGLGQVLVVGGIGTTSVIASAELYDPTSNSWTPTASMTAARSSHTATLLGSGKVLVVGGNGTAGVVQKSAELYEPTSNSWTLAASLTGARLSHTASLLASGKVLVAGGTSGSSYENLAELYDPTNNKWALAGNATTARTNHAASVLASGKVMVTGGAGSAGYLASAELHSPLANGAACTGAGECVSGFCSDRVCCDSACTSGCMACDVAGSLGACTSVVGAPHGSRSCGRYLCAGASATCPTSCASDADCSAGNWCAAGACVAKRAVGTTCPTGAHECASGLCVDGICCGTACTSSCQACDVAGSLGTCANVLGAPHGARAACGAHLCEGITASCPTSCGSDAGCVAGSWCDAGTCAGKRSNGSACPTGARECASGHCVDGVCCDSACSSACQACDVVGGLGACTNVVGLPHGARGDCGSFLCQGAVAGCPSSCASDDECMAGHWCASGTCVAKSSSGAACPTGSHECANGLCVDGVCCNVACAGQCEACDVVPGTCSAVSGAPHGGRAACGGTGSCAATCDGSNRFACGAFPVTSVPCAAARCDAASGKAYATSFCDGLGACVPSGSTTCGGYLCNGVACGTTCATAAECVSGYACKAGSCVPQTGTTCAAASDCTSGFCVDGLCCDSACDGQCEACDAVGSKGTCMAVAGAPHGARAPCTDGGGDVCKAKSCDKNDRTQCAAFAGTFTPCAPASCTGDKLTRAATCDGAGACEAQTTSSCSPFRCADATRCASACATSADCADGYGCVASSCSPKAAACSSDGNGVVPPSGAEVDCKPFKCNAGTCLARCTDSTQCQAGSRCDDDFACVPVGDPPATKGSDCSLGARADATVGTSLGVAALGAFLRRRRSRTRS